MSTRAESTSDSDATIPTTSPPGRAMPDSDSADQSGLSDIEFWLARLQDFTFVYVIQGEPGTPIKVGIAKDPVARMATLQTGNPQTLRLLHVVPGRRGLEATLHQRLRNANVRGEWFSGPEVTPFLEWVAHFSREARSRYERAGQLPFAMRAPSRMGRSGPLTIHYTEPSPVMDPERASQIRARLSRSPFVNFFEVDTVVHYTERIVARVDEIDRQSLPDYNKLDYVGDAYAFLRDPEWHNRIRLRELRNRPCPPEEKPEAQAASEAELLYRQHERRKARRQRESFLRRRRRGRVKLSDLLKQERDEAA